MSNLELFFVILLALAILWSGLSLFMYRRAKKMFKKYANIPRPSDPEAYAAIMRRDFGNWDEKQIIKGCFTRFPLHFGLFFLYIFIFASCAHLNKWIRFPTRNLIDWYSQMAGRAVFRIMMKIQQDFDHREKIDTAFIVSNHVSEIDFCYQRMCLRPVSFVSKIQHKEVFCIGTIAVYLKTLFINRSSEDSRNQALSAIKNRVQQFQNDPENVPPTVIYAQGTVSNGRSLLKFKNGAFSPMVPLTLMSLRYECQQFHLGHDQLQMMEVILTTFCLKPTLKVKKKRVKPLEGESVDDYRQRCRGLIAEMGGLTLRDYSTKQVWQYWYMTRDMLKQQNRLHTQ